MERGKRPTPALITGVVYLAYTVFDECVGEEVQRIEAIPCCRCAEAYGRASHGYWR